jgi:hypothetical protein
MSPSAERSMMPAPMAGMKLSLALATVLLITPRLARGREFLTPQEIEKIQDAQEIDKRVKIYMEAASLRLTTAEERLNGKESSPGDPLEFFTVEEMVDGYYRILKSVMANVDDVASRPFSDRKALDQALQTLKTTTGEAVKQLEILKKLAEDKQREELWNLVNRAIDIAKGAHEGAEAALAGRSTPSKAKKR